MSGKGRERVSLSTNVLLVTRGGGVSTRAGADQQPPARATGDSYTRSSCPQGPPALLMRYQLLLCLGRKMAIPGSCRTCQLTKSNSPPIVLSPLSWRSVQLVSGCQSTKVGVILQVLVHISYSGGIFQSHKGLGWKRGRPGRTLLQKQAQLCRGAFSNPNLSRCHRRNMGEEGEERSRSSCHHLPAVAPRPRVVLRCSIHLQFPSLEQSRRLLNPDQRALGKAHGPGGNAGEPRGGQTDRFLLL